MVDADLSGRDWSDVEIECVISAYVSMLALELADRPYVKAEFNRSVQAATGRSKGAIEYKFQNISAVLFQLGLPWISGYAPMANFQQALMLGIERLLSQENNFFQTFKPGESSEFSEEPITFLEAPPNLIQPTLIHDKNLERLVRKFDPAARDERNRSLGLRGEELILRFERARLEKVRPDLAGKIRWVSQDDGDGAGFDILSFDLTGEERLIEVKTTIGHQKTPFFISANEVALSEERPQNFRLMRVFDFLSKPRAFELIPPLSNSVILAPQSYRASFQ